MPCGNHLFDQLINDANSDLFIELAMTLHRHSNALFPDEAFDVTTSDQIFVQGVSIVGFLLTVVLSVNGQLKKICMRIPNTTVQFTTD